MSQPNQFKELRDKTSQDAPIQVLIIEDNLLNLKMISSIIKAQGYEVLEAKTGLLGLELAREHHPAVIVTDIRLPDISGLEVTRLLKTDLDTVDIAVIGTSAHAAAGDGDTQDAGCDAFVPKPISISDFIQILRSLSIRGPTASNLSGMETATNGPEPAA